MAGCTAIERASEERERLVVVDERAGVLRDVRFGDTGLEVLDRLGSPTDDEDGAFPAGVDYTGPPSIESPPSDHGRRTPPAFLHYRNFAYIVSPTAGVYAMATLARGARTLAGVGVGDELERVRDSYDEVECGEAIAGESFLGPPPTYPWCRATVGAIDVFFGEDPVESITLTPAAAHK